MYTVHFSFDFGWCTKQHDIAGYEQKVGRYYLKSIKYGKTYLTMIPTSLLLLKLK